MKEIFNGLVIRGIVDKGSKSEHEAILLKTNEGDLQLQLMGDNPFENHGLQEFVGWDVIVRGHLEGNRLLVSAKTDISVMPSI